MRALWLPSVLRAAGLRVVEVDGWAIRGKEMDAIEGIVNHHTASPTASTLNTNLSVVINGNSIAPGPIAQVLLWRDGTCYIIASGKANHAGAGGPWGWLPLSPPGQLSIANARTIGIEAVNNGTGEPWAPAMIDAYLALDAAILKQIGRPASRVLTHHEWAPTRKIDPAGPTGGRVAMLPGLSTWSGDAWRALIAAKMQTPAPPTPTPTPQPPEEDEMKIYCNKASREGNDPTKIKYALQDDGHLRHLGFTEWTLRGSIEGEQLTNAQIDELGVI